MSVIAATYSTWPIQQASTTGLTPGLSAGSASFGTGSSNTKTSGFLSGAVTAQQQAVVGAPIGAQKNEEFGGQLFDKILVIPYAKNLGFILSPKVFTVEVWSTYKQKAQTLSSISVLNDSQTFVTDPYGTPETYWPQQSLTYTVTVKETGSGSVGAVVTWTFNVPAGSLTITGTRVFVFAAAPNWESGITERYGYLTDVFQAYNDNEQRIQLRAVPIRGLSYEVVTDTQKRSALMQAVLYQWQSSPVGVPWWPEVAVLAADANSGSSTVSIDTTNKDFVNGGLAVLWTDADTWEAVQIQTVGPSSFTTNLPLQNSWAATKTLVLPVRVSRMKNALELSHPANFASTITVDFTVEITG